MQTSFSRFVRSRGCALVIAATLVVSRGEAQTTAEAPATRPVPVEIFEVLKAIEGATDERYTNADVLKILHASWWDLIYTPEEMELARALGSAARPILVSTADGRQLTFTKQAADDASRQQRFLLPAYFDGSDSSYFVHAFRISRNANLFVAACRVHENAAEVMTMALMEMVNQARATAKSAGEAPLIRLFTALEQSHREANPEVQGEFVTAVRRVMAKFESNRSALPQAVWEAAWLQVPAN